MAVTSPTYQPMQHKGALQRASPEEITAAFIFTVARDIDNHEADEVILQWNAYVLSTTCRFVFLPTQVSRYWHALEQREQLDHAYRVCHRSCYQRLHEVVRLVDRMKQSGPASQVTPQRVEQVYKENLPMMVKGSPGHVTLNFIDVRLTVAKRMLAAPDIAECMRDLDDRSAYAAEEDGKSFVNPFDSHSRLQAILDKCKASQPGALSWCMQGIWYTARKGFLNRLSITDIKGSASSANRGLIDLLLFKQQMRRVLLAKSHQLFGSAAQDWIDGAVARHTDSFALQQVQQSGDRSWRSGRSSAEVAWLNTLAEMGCADSTTLP